MLIKNRHTQASYQRERNTFRTKCNADVLQTYNNVTTYRDDHCVPPLFDENCHVVTDENGHIISATIGNKQKHALKK